MIVTGHGLKTGKTYRLVQATTNLQMWCGFVFKVLDDYSQHCFPHKSGYVAARILVPPPNTVWKRGEYWKDMPVYPVERYEELTEEEAMMYQIQ